MATELQDILKLEVPLIVQIAEHELSVEEVRNLVPGAILELPKNTADDLEILVNDQNIAQGKAVKVGENFGVRITYVGNLAERIEAMGRDAQQEQEQENASSDGASDVSDLDADALAEQMLSGQ